MEGSKPSQVLRDSLYAVKFYYEARPWLFILLVLVFACRRSFRRQVCFSRKPLWTGSSRVPMGLSPWLSQPTFCAGLPAVLRSNTKSSSAPLFPT